MTVHNYLKGRYPSFEFLASLRNRLGIRSDWIITGVGPMYAEEEKCLSPDVQEIIDWVKESPQTEGALLLLKEEKLRPFVEKHAPHLLADLKRNGSKAG